MTALALLLRLFALAWGLSPDPEGEGPLSLPGRVLRALRGGR